MTLVNRFSFRKTKILIPFQLMWVKFNSRNERSRRIADQNLTATFNKFVHLMWHPGVIDIELDIVQKLRLDFSPVCNNFCIFHLICVKFKN